VSIFRVNVLEVLPFTSEGGGGNCRPIYDWRKRKEQDFLGGGEENSNSGDILFYQKGANTVMFSIIQDNDWLNNRCSDMVPEGLRILVVGRKNLSIQRYQGFSAKHKAAFLMLINRGKEMGKALGEYIDHDLKHAGARCVAVSAKLVSGGKYAHTIAKCMPTPLFSYLRIILTPVRLCSKTKRPSVRCPRIPPQNDRLLSPHRRRTHRTLPRHV